MAFTRCLCITFVQHINFLTVSIEWLRILSFHLRDDARPVAKISPRVMISVVSQYVIGFTCHNESMLIGLFRQRQFADERKWLFVSADVRGAGKRDEPLRTSAREATLVDDCG